MSVSTLAGVLIGWAVMTALIIGFKGDLARAARWFFSGVAIFALILWVLP